MSIEVGKAFDNRKRCPRCDHWLPLWEFSRDRSKADGLQSWCKNCKRLSKYLADDDDLRELYHKQGGRCAICQRKRKLDIDHDHDTDEVRGLLCGPCNRGVGLLGDTPDMLRAAARYLEGRTPRTYEQAAADAEYDRLVATGHHLR